MQQKQCLDEKYGIKCIYYKRIKIENQSLSLPSWKVEKEEKRKHIAGRKKSKRK